MSKVIDNIEDIASIDAKANLASPTFTGTPTLPTGTIAATQAAGDNSTKVATTAFAKTVAESNAIGVGQTWQDVLASRAFNVTYTNSTGKPIEVAITILSSAIYTYARFYVDGVWISSIGNGNSSGDRLFSFSHIVKPNSTYKLEYQDAPSISKWFELR